MVPSGSVDNFEMIFHNWRIVDNARVELIRQSFNIILPTAYHPAMSETPLCISLIGFATFLTYSPSGMFSAVT